MAKVMISVPDDLLARLDAEARRRGVSRSRFLRELVDRELALDADKRRETILAILAGAQDHGGDSTEFIRAMRNSR